MFLRKKVKVGLVLGSGGAKGLSHVGVIKVLEQEGIPIDVIAGSSIGALVGGLYAATRDISAVEQLALKTNWKELISLIDPSWRHGLMGGDKIKKFIEKQVGNITFSDLKIPFIAVATDLKTAKPVIMREGDVSFAIRSSIAIPLVFKPVVYGDALLVDGGLSLPLPVSVVKEMGADMVIAIDLYADYYAQTKEASVSFTKLSGDIFNLLRFHLAKENRKGADIIVTPRVSATRWSSLFTSEKTKAVILAGEEAMRERLFETREALRPRREPFLRRLADLLFPT